MNRREFVVSTCAGVVALSQVPRVAGQAKTITPDLGGLADSKSLKLFNRAASRLADGARKGVRLSEAPGEGVAFLPGIEFANGTVELDVRGKDVAQQSFVGVAFHGLDGAAYDAIYFRPFNFRATDSVSRSHAVQYHSLPLYTWQKLRTDQPGKYEQAVNPVPDPNAWFHARIVIANQRASVFVGDGKDPCLVVSLLNGRTKGLIGLWVGNNSGGDFANLAITPAA
ncbi:MAG TPA: hypothetical protein VGZ27_15545 [Vicinamibacterales bacterium]|jgi:hypothetical protein|nr:hypothetical protein [Vicinamibacterales bacterium]